MTQKQILNFIQTHKSYMEEQYGVKKIGLFGSYATGKATKKSDIDIAIEIKSTNSFRSFFGLLHFLEDGLQHKIDLGIESSLKPVVKERIMKEIIYV